MYVASQGNYHVVDCDTVLSAGGWLLLPINPAFYSLVVSDTHIIHTHKFSYFT